jgi:hypothetical protein
MKFYLYFGAELVAGVGAEPAVGVKDINSQPGVKRPD